MLQSNVVSTSNEYEDLSADDLRVVAIQLYNLLIQVQTFDLEVTGIRPAERFAGALISLVESEITKANSVLGIVNPLA